MQEIYMPHVSYYAFSNTVQPLNSAAVESVGEWLS